jgi:hypothetical protein
MRLLRDYRNSAKRNHPRVAVQAARSLEPGSGS